ncbi:MAG: glucose-6-phosphate isomerase [Clostridium butyricum]|uniref:glucose-6-phosphate isomerase n=1 Tax=Clostridium sp. TaxID=1506 RepID=UPI002900BFF4|nr:glucose-6-phosphate isomerase [Clostridium sp.]MDU1115190.1 glucose-6-phosphate isomerase [Clostridium sp.]MDU7711126.1 glucose-6-phosphate isomerase [Clostridium butyricum]
MSDRISLDLTYIENFIGKNEIDNYRERVSFFHKQLHEKTGAGNEFLGWISLPNKYDENIKEKIKRAAEKIKSDSDVLVVIGIGGSYLGTRAAIDMLRNNKEDTVKGIKVLYAGNNLSSNYLISIIKQLERKDVSLNVISKSGTTTEPALAFRILKSHLEKKYGKKEASKRIYVTTDNSKGALKELSNKEGYETFVIPDDIGGRFTVLTPVGLLPIAAAGIDIDEILNGAVSAMKSYSVSDLDKNDSYKYAVLRNILYDKGINIEVLVNYEPCLHYFNEWWKQLFGESEGKDKKGIFPATVDFSTDLHSMGQYIQDGRRILFETVMNVKHPYEDITIERDDDNLDKLNFLEGRTMDFINKQAFKGTLMAHKDGGVPNIVIDIPEITPYYFGYLVYFFEKACGMSGYLLGINPFNQPGVEAYKNNMFALLGKPGYEDVREKIENMFK